MKDAIARLAYIRHCVAGRKTLLAEKEAHLHATPEWERLEWARESLRKANVEQAVAEVEVRKQAMKVFIETDDRTPHPAVKIKDFTVLDYDDGDAIEYAREHLPKALKLIKRIFEKVAKVLELDFVTVWQEPRATIARDLSEYLEVI